MTFLNATITGKVRQLWAKLHRRNPAREHYGDETPLRSELFSVSQMEQHGRILAAGHALSEGHTPEQLLARLGENERVLHEVRDLLAQAVKGDRLIGRYEVVQALRIHPAVAVRDHLQRNVVYAGKSG